MAFCAALRTARTTHPPTGRVQRPRASRALLAALLVLAGPTLLLAHATLLGSSPGAGEVVHGRIPDIRLQFSEPVEPRYTALVLVSPVGTELPIGPVLPLTDSRSEFAAALATPLEPGIHTVRWQTAGTDGHVIRGTFSFVVRPEDAPLPLPGEAVIEVPPGSDEPVAASYERASPLTLVARWLNLAALLAMVGTVGFRFGVLGQMARDPRTAAAVPGSLAGVRRLAAVAIAAAALALAARLWNQSVALHGPEAAASLPLIATLLTVTVWGYGWLLQALCLAIFSLAILAARAAQPSAFVWAIAAAAAAGSAFVPALSGHAVAVEDARALAVLSNGIHVLGAGLWLGTLLVVAVVGIPAAARFSTPERAAAVAGMIAKFSPVALLGVGMLLASGIVNALFLFSAPEQLWTTDYGRTLLLKILLFAIAAAFGLYNWRALRPRLDDPTTTRPLRRSATGELIVGTLLLLATALLVSLPTPG